MDLNFIKIGEVVIWPITGMVSVGMVMEDLVGLSVDIAYKS